MKQLHHHDLSGRSAFDEDRHIDFNRCAGGRLRRLPPPGLSDSDASQGGIEWRSRLPVAGTLGVDGRSIFCAAGQRPVEPAKGV